MVGETKSSKTSLIDCQLMCRVSSPLGGTLVRIVSPIPASASLHQVSTDSIVVVYSSINGNIDVHSSVCGGGGGVHGWVCQWVCCKVLEVFTGSLLNARSNLDMFTLVCLPLWDGVCCVGSGPIVLPTTSLSCCGLLSDCQHHVSTVLSTPPAHSSQHPHV